MIQTKISVIIPVFNAEKYLRQCIDSVVTQTLQDIEIICVNDGSTDRSCNIVEEYVKKDSRLKIVNQKNQGAARARNAGIKMAKGEYIHFLDADDYLVPDVYEVLYKKAKTYNLDFIKGETILLDNLSQEKTPKPISKDAINVITNFYVTPTKFLQTGVTPWKCLYKRSFLLSNNICFYNLRCGEDRSFYVSVIIRAKRVMFVDKYVIYYRFNNPNSLNEQRPKYYKCFFDSYKIINKMCKHLPENLRREILENELEELFSWLIKYKSKHMLSKEIYSDIKYFIINLDITPFREKYLYSRWYKRYLEITGIKAYFNENTLNI
ncbi:MAG: glycosyltransferase, partial [Dehalococcoidales bacterium]|nr:glycosyltransferase [Dehalococcoidales bacterium]